MKNIACVHCNIKKLATRMYFFDLLKTTLKKNMTFKVDTCLGMEGVYMNIDLQEQILPFTLHHVRMYKKN